MKYEETQRGKNLFATCSCLLPAPVPFSYALPHIHITSYYLCARLELLLMDRICVCGYFHSSYSYSFALNPTKIQFSMNSFDQENGIDMFSITQIDWNVAWPDVGRSGGASEGGLLFNLRDSPEPNAIGLLLMVENCFRSWALADIKQGRNKWIMSPSKNKSN